MGEPKPLGLRIQDILLRREKIMPLMHPGTYVDQDAAAAFLTEEAKARAAVNADIRRMVMPFAASIHAAVSDLQLHPESLLYPSPRGDFLQIAVEGNHPDRLTYVALTPKTIKSDGKKETICESAVFLEAPRAIMRRLTKLPMRTNFTSSNYSNDPFRYPYSIDLPDHFTRLTIMDFNPKKGTIGITCIGNDGTGFYGISDKGVYVEKISLSKWYQPPRYQFSEVKSSYGYLYGSDGKFRRETVDLEKPGIDDEIAGILARLPLPELHPNDSSSLPQAESE